MSNGDNQRAGTQHAAAAHQGQAALAEQVALLQRHFAAGNFGAAEGVCRQLLKSAPGDLNFTLMLGEIVSSQGRHEDALMLLEPLVKQWPNAAPAHFFLGNVLHAAGRYSEAATHLRRATELQPHYPGAHYNLGLSLARLGDKAGAIHAYERALLLDPNLWHARNNLGITLLEAEKPEEAVIHLRQAAALNPSAGNTQSSLGRALHRIGQIEEAQQCFERAVALDPRLDGAWIGIGTVMRTRGRFAEAAAAFEKALAINPNLSVVRQALTTVRKQIADTDELERMRQTLGNPDAPAEERGAAGMAMAKILDDSGRYDEAFAAAEKGNRFARAAQLAADIRYDHAAFCAQNDLAMRLFTPAFFAARRDWGNPTELPVFIVGFFRTGSTLVEQICASHSQVHGAGELRDMGYIAAHVQGTAPERWTRDLFRPLADQHAERLAALAPGKSRVIDKELDVLFLLGLIPLLFPRARVIFTHRDGRDAALSAFLQHLDRRAGFATDLLDAGRRWHESERMAAHWSRCLPLAMHHVHYETLVADFETEARKLVDFLGLSWEPACLEFHKTERLVSTASAWQVRQPLYASSVGRWRNYAKHLGPLCAAIGIDPEAPTGTPPADIE